MNLALLSAAIETRVTSDTGAGGMFASGAQLINHVCFDTPIPGQQTPLLIVTFPELTELDTFTDDAQLVTIEFVVVIERAYGTFATDSAILKRLKALFHRWQPTTGLSTYSAQAFARRTGTTQHDEDYRRYIERYTTRFTENAVGPA